MLIVVVTSVVVSSVYMWLCARVIAQTFSCCYK